MSEAGYQVEWQILKLEVRISNDNWANWKEEQKISLSYMARTSFYSIQKLKTIQIF